MDENFTSLGGYLAVLRRRKMQIIIPALLILLLSMGVAFGLPPVYRSSATIMVEQQEVPTELVESTVTSYAAERIRVITELIMTRSSLLDIIKEYDLYPELRREGNLEEMLYEMRKSIEVTPISAEIIAELTGRLSTTTIAFEVAFESNTPEKAQKVADKLVSLYLKNNSRLRAQSAESTTKFLAGETERLSKEIVKLEEKIAAYKEKNIGQLPQLFEVNLKLMEQAESKLNAIQYEVDSLEERKAALQAQLWGAEPYLGTSPQAHLRELKTALLDAKARYAPKHPDVVRLERKVSVLEEELGGVNTTGQLQQKIAQVSAKLAEVRRKYSEQHPDVSRLEQALASLKSQSSQALPEEVNEIKATNPAYISLQSQLKTIDIRLKSERDKQRELQERTAEYQNRIEQMPQVEQKGFALKRNYDNAVQKYRELKEKQLRAETASQLERENKGESFSVLNSPMLPQSPYRPNRIAILIIGMFFSFTSGISYAGFSEYFDTSVRGAKGVKSVLKTPPLAAIPYIQNKADLQYQQKKKLIIYIAILLSIVLPVTAIHYYWMPIYSLWSSQDRLPDQQEVSDK